MYLFLATTRGGISANPDPGPGRAEPRCADRVGMRGFSFVREISLQGFSFLRDLSFLRDFLMRDYPLYCMFLL